MTDDPAVIRRRASAVLGTGRALRATSTAERAVWLAETAAELRRSARQAAQELSDTTGLSVPMVDWAARTTLDTIDQSSLLDLATNACPRSEHASAPISMLALVLAGNVFTASVRSVFVALLVGAPVLVKASSKEMTFPAMTRDALRAVNPTLGAAMDTVTFRGGDVDCEAALVEHAEAVSVYGGDETVAAMASRVGWDSLIAHGHGVSVAYCGAGALSDALRGETIAGLSLDICAYDQRGCLSPQLVFVETSAKQSAEDFAIHLAEQGLAPMERTLPRGPLPASVGAEQAQWRGVAEVEGTLIRGRSYGIAVRSAESIRWSPGYRNVTVVPVRTIDEAFEAMIRMGGSLKCVGADPASLSDVRARLAENLALSAYSCPIGSMQTPALDAPADGFPIWHGLLSPREVTPRRR